MSGGSVDIVQAHLYHDSGWSDFFQEISFPPNVYETCCPFFSLHFFPQTHYLPATAQIPSEWLFDHYQVSCPVSTGSTV